MAKIVSLKTVRKQKSRQEKRQAGDENAARHGMSKAQKSLDSARADKARRDLDAHRKDDPDT